MTGGTGLSHTYGQVSKKIILLQINSAGSGIIITGKTVPEILFFSGRSYGPVTFPCYDIDYKLTDKNLQSL